MGPSETGPETDVVVIGAGHNGLVAACYLARAGLRTVVVEAGKAPGGMSASGPEIPDAPGHMVNTGAAELLFLQRTPIPDHLELRRHGLRTVVSDPSYVYLHPDGCSIAYWRDAGRTVDEIAHFSRRDAHAYRDLTRTLHRLLAVAAPMSETNPMRPSPAALARAGRAAVRGWRSLPGAAALAASSGEQLILERFEHPVVRSALYSLIGGVAPVTDRGSAMSAIFLAFLHDSGVLRPIGGMQAVPNALLGCLREHGGELWLGSAVETLTMRDGRASGVVLDDGRSITARRGVISACDPRQTLTRLLPGGALPRRFADRAARLPANAAGNGWLKIDMAVRTTVTVSMHQKWRGDRLDLRRPALMIGPMENVRRGYADAVAGRVPKAEDMLVWCFCPTGIDPTQAPAGQDVLYLSTPSVPVRPVDGWDRVRGPAVDRLLAQAGQYYDTGLDQEIGRRVETPDTLAQRLRVTNGCYFHVDFVPARSGPLRPALGLGGYRTPVAGLYLAGAGTHPGGGVMGTSGRLAAQRLLADNGKAGAASGKA
jgi:phytoene dehydrogenase-like protein